MTCFVCLPGVLCAAVVSFSPPAVAAATLIISRRPPCSLNTISMCTHILWPRLKFMKSPPSSRGGFAAGPSQERNELIVTLRLLLSISELSTAVDRRRPGRRPSVTGRRHQETKQTAGSQKTQPGVTAGGAKHPGDGGGD